MSFSGFQLADSNSASVTRPTVTIHKDRAITVVDLFVDKKEWKFASDQGLLLICDFNPSMQYIG
jgi:hypothetical protein